MQIYQFSGTFLKEGSTYRGQSLKFIQATRKEFTPKKGKHFLLFSSEHHQRPEYWSSLYTTDKEHIYTAEYSGKTYQVEFTAFSLTITEI